MMITITTTTTTTTTTTHVCLSFLSIPCTAEAAILFPNSYMLIYSMCIGVLVNISTRSPYKRDSSILLAVAWRAYARRANGASSFSCRFGYLSSCIPYIYTQQKTCGENGRYLDNYKTYGLQIWQVYRRDDNLRHIKI